MDETPKLTLYSYWNSSCSFRVRIALNLKGLKYEYKALRLLSGDQYSPEYKKLNPISTHKKLNPIISLYHHLVDGDKVVADSLAIIMYLEENPQTPLLPSDVHKRAINYQAATIVSSGIQPFQNLYGHINYLEPMKTFMQGKLSPDESLQWLQYHIKQGFAALEDVLRDHAGRYATGDQLYLADLFLAPQIDAAIRRFGVDLNEFPLLKRMNEAYTELPAFVDVHPANQPDAPPIFLKIKKENAPL